MITEFKKKVLDKFQEEIDSLNKQDIGREIMLVGHSTRVVMCENDEKVRKYLVHEGIDISF